MTRDTIDWRPLSPTFGAEVDVDLTRPLSAAQQDAWRTLFRTRSLIVVRGQGLSDSDQERATRLLGAPIPGLNVEGQVSNITYVSTDGTKGGLGGTELAFHSDLSFAPHPFDGICLYGLKLTDGASSTRWISAADTYARLPADLRKRIDGLSVLNVISNVRVERNRFNGREPTLPATVHPLVRRTEDGAPFLYANEAQTDHVVGLSPRDSDALLDELFGWLYDPERVIEHVWRNADLVVWDNQILQHARGDVSAVGERTLRRVQLGPASLHDQFPDYMQKIRSSFSRGLRPEDVAY